LTKLENGRTNRASPKGLFVIAILGKNSHLSMNYYFCVHTIGLRNLEGLVPKMSRSAATDPTLRFICRKIRKFTP
jgi:hypothetical protein